MFKVRPVLALSCAIMAHTILILADEVTKAPTLAEYVGHKYLFSMFGEKKPATTTANNESPSFIERVKKQLGKVDTQRQTLTPREVQKIAFDLIIASSSLETSIIDEACVDKLEIVAGGENAQQYLLEHIFADTQTSIGKAYSALTLCHPTSDITLLKNRQQAVALISKNNHFVNSSTAALKMIASSESKSLQPWLTTSPVNADLLKRFYLGLGLNTQTIPLEIYNKGLSSLQAAWGLVGTPLLKIYINCLIFQTDFTTGAHIVLDRITSDQIPLEMKLLENIDLLLQSLYTYQAYSSLKSTAEIANHLQDGLIATAAHIQELKKLSSLISKNKELLQCLPSLQPLADFNNSAKHSARLNKLLGMLDTNTFKGKASFFSITGRILAAYELMKQVKDEIAPAFAAAGELDMYIALAKLYNSREGKDARYCMVEFVENSTTPIIKADGFWNPFINPDTVVINDATFDSSCPNSILTGPNTSGKSTVIKAIMFDILMAQVFGIAPAKRLVITPFTKLSCFMNISDDIATGASLFKSEIIRAKKLLDLVQSLEQNEFSFVIIDEVFTGTSPQEGEQAALQFAKKIATYSNNISIIATHYPKMTNLETETNGSYRNHHVEILRNEDGSLNRTFKLRNGPSFVNVAFDILEEEGLFV